jgi:hypothetical protein
MQPITPIYTIPGSDQKIQFDQSVPVPKSYLTYMENITSDNDQGDLPDNTQRFYVILDTKPDVFYPLALAAVCKANKVFRFFLSSAGSSEMWNFFVSLTRIDPSFHQPAICRIFSFSKPLDFVTQFVKECRKSQDTITTFKQLIDSYYSKEETEKEGKCQAIAAHIHINPLVQIIMEYRSPPLPSEVEQLFPSYLRKKSAEKK